MNFTSLAEKKKNDAKELILVMDKVLLTYERPKSLSKVSYLSVFAITTRYYNFKLRLNKQKNYQKYHAS